MEHLLHNELWSGLQKICENRKTAIGQEWTGEAKVDATSLQEPALRLPESSTAPSGEASKRKNCQKIILVYVQNSQHQIGFNLVAYQIITTFHSHKYLYSNP